MKRQFIISINVALLLFYLSAGAQNVQPFKAGDRVVFEGNSITHGGHYHSYVWLYYMTHFPGTRIQIFNCGIGGDVAGGMYNRLDSDVFAKKPTVIFLTFGMNDAGYYEYLKPDAAELSAKKVAKSYEDYKKIEKRFQDYKQAQKVIMSSPPFDETAKLKSQNFPGKNAAMLRIDSFQEASAQQNHWGFIDLNRPMTAINEREQQKDSSFTLQGSGRVHPDNDGHLVIAYLILKKQGLAGKDVANIQIDANTGKINKEENCTITLLQVSPTAVKFNYLAKSLPYPVDTVVRGWGETKPASAALPVIPFMKAFNNEQLVISNLPKAKYILKIDGQKIGVWSADAFAKGINLAEQKNTPEYQQALEIMELNEERWEIEKRFRDYAWMEYSFLQDKGMLFHDDMAALNIVNEEAKTNPFVRGNLNAFVAGHYKNVREIWNNEMKQIVDKIYTINKPVTHKIELEAIL
ncbi:MAG: SGNH/GDSL hydrolase family protein [Chitinophagaceae bacterium]|jgi:lysophospholipase L1-like esterase|nr:SGNH/GDSL hydrolase family protein [Chitinophagaceae bacterium]